MVAEQLSCHLVLNSIWKHIKWIDENKTLKQKGMTGTNPIQKKGQIQSCGLKRKGAINCISVIGSIN